MKIKEINIAAFGGIKNRKISINDGLNVILGDNENGKTTVMAFIKMMFYGNGRNSSDIAKNMRKKYTPWDGADMAGSIDFEHGGRNYRIEREFRKSDATDKVTLCDLDLGTRTVAEPDIGRRFFGLTSAGFERSVFIGQFGFPEGDPEGEIGKRLSNIALTGDESVSFETVSSRLTKAKNALVSKSGTAGAYDKNIKAIEELKIKLQKSTEAYETYALVKEKLKQSGAEILTMQKKAAELKQKISAEQDIRNAAKLKELLTLKAELDSLNHNLALSDGGIADEAYVKKLQFCINKADAAQIKVDSVRKEIEILENSIADAQSGSREEKEAQKVQIINDIESLEQKRTELSGRIKAARTEESDLILALSSADQFKKRANSLMLNLGGIIFVIAVILGFALKNTVSYSPIISAVLAVAGLVVFALGFVIRPTDKKAYENCRIKAQSLRDEISESEFGLNDITAEISLLKARLEAVSAALSGNAEQLKGNQKRLLDCKQELTILEADVKTENETLYGLFARYKKEFSAEDIKPAIDVISANAAKQKELKQRINYILKDVGNISYEDAAEKLKAIGDKADSAADFEQIKSDYDRVLTEISDKKSRLAEVAARAEESLNGVENPEDIKKQISDKTAAALSQKDYCDRLSIAMEVLAESNIEVRRSYGSELEKKAAEILLKLTNGRYDSMTISKNLEVAVAETDKFGSREIEYLSSGTADQAYLSMRLAISSIMAGDSDPLPLFMDDSLAQYDDNRMKTALNFLKDYSSQNQIILFTCHKNICQEAQSLGANIL